jgi:xanthine dehydrogenase YagR molybdenum-binding subunit
VIGGWTKLYLGAYYSPHSPGPQWTSHSLGAAIYVNVNCVADVVWVSRFLGSFDCVILTFKSAASRFRGGIVMGLSLALMEESQFDERSGRIMNPSLAEYHVPVHLDVPEIDIIWTDISDLHTPMAARDVGEIDITGVAAAVANAVYNAATHLARVPPTVATNLCAGFEEGVRRPAR